MYIPKINQIEDSSEIYSFIRENSFGILINSDGDFPFATHIPMELFEGKNGEWIIQCHIAKANPQWKYFENNSKTLCIFSGAHSYVSSSWYNSVSVPTWNYMAVHIYGNARILDASGTEGLLSKQIDTYEAGRSNPVKMDEYEEGMIQKMMKGVVGIEISVEEVQAKYKLSQNKNAQDFENVVHQLEKSKNPNSNLIADKMKKLKKL